MLPKGTSISNTWKIIGTDIQTNSNPGIIVGNDDQWR